MKGLPTLTRLAKRELDEYRNALGLLEGEAAQIQSLQRAHEETVNYEAALAAGSVETARTFGAYIEMALERRAALAAAAADLAVAISAVQEKIVAAFRGFKRYEIIAAQNRKRDRRETEKRDQAALDEIAVDRFRRDGRSPS